MSQNRSASFPARYRRKGADWMPAWPSVEMPRGAAKPGSPPAVRYRAVPSVLREIDRRSCIVESLRSPLTPIPLQSSVNIRYGRLTFPVHCSIFRDNGELRIASRIVKLLLAACSLAIYLVHPMDNILEIRLLHMNILHLAEPFEQAQRLHRAQLLAVAFHRQRVAGKGTAAQRVRHHLG